MREPVSVVSRPKTSSNVGGVPFHCNFYVPFLFPILVPTGSFLSLHGQEETYQGEGKPYIILYAHKQTCIPAPQPTSSAPQRPRLPLTPNAKIPTALRQKFLESFIDEHLKRNPVPEVVYGQVGSLYTD